MKKLLSIIILLTFVISVIFCFTSCKSKTEIDSTDFDSTKLDNTYQPKGAPLEGIVIPTEEDSTEMKNLVVELYDKANYNAQHDDTLCYSVYNVSPISILKADSIAYRYFVKNGTEFFNSNYFYTDGSAMGAGIMASVSGENVHFSQRVYYNSDLEYGYSQKSKVMEYKVAESGAVSFGADWNDLYNQQEISAPKEMLCSGLEYTFSSFLIEADTITKANITHDNAGFYKINIELDCSLDKTMAKELPFLVGAAGDPKARYTKVKMDIEIWDCGRFKKFFCENSWSSKNAYGMHLKVDAVNNYQTSFYYNDYALNIRNYQYAEEFIELVKEKAQNK